MQKLYINLLSPRTTVAAVVHRDIYFPITSTLLTHCHHDLSRWVHAQAAVIVHADEKLSTVGL
ncbi:hypothetical protein DPMN_168902 [Dreissena polymorpha]|uniref:Uncharacterized protein n=1 Tax=Dreissena polymorpha TaxID=45954 RepID=A0A9D4F6E9_DREPO|nr:hypothetical protein DPMN_168902 [Dreissena polymorpha]